MDEGSIDSRFAGFVSANRERARRLAWRLVGGDAAAADDVTQDALLQAYRAIDRFREDASLETWFYRILVRQARSYRRWKRVRDLWGGLADENTPEAVAAESGDAEMARRIEGAMQKLTEAQRDAFVLVHLEGFTVREAADTLRRAEGTVKSHVHRALGVLREQLADLARDEGLVA